MKGFWSRDECCRPCHNLLLSVCDLSLAKELPPWPFMITLWENLQCDTKWTKCLVHLLHHDPTSAFLPSLLFYVGSFTGSPPSSSLIQGHLSPTFYHSLHKMLLRPWRVRITQITRLWPGWAGLLPVLQHELRPFCQLSSHIVPVNRSSRSLWFITWSLYISSGFKFSLTHLVG